MLTYLGVNSSDCHRPDVCHTKTMIPRTGETLAFLDELGGGRTVQIRHACKETRLVIVLPDM